MPKPWRNCRSPTTTNLGYHYIIYYILMHRMIIFMYYNTIMGLVPYFSSQIGPVYKVLLGPILGIASMPFRPIPPYCIRCCNPELAYSIHISSMLIVALFILATALVISPGPLELCSLSLVAAVGRHPSRRQYYHSRICTQPRSPPPKLHIYVTNGEMERVGDQLRRS